MSFIANMFCKTVDFVGRKTVWKYNKDNKKIADKYYNEILNINDDKELAKKMREVELQKATNARRILFWQKISKLFD